MVIENSIPTPKVSTDVDRTLTAAKTFLLYIPDELFLTTTPQLDVLITPEEPLGTLSAVVVRKATTFLASTYA